MRWCPQYVFTQEAAPLLGFMPVWIVERTWQPRFDSAAQTPWNTWNPQSLSGQFQPRRPY
jgi:hypothetical protein